MPQSDETTTIYIRLLDEATTCWRPTQATAMPDGNYRVLPTTNYDPTDEVWEFAPGSTVHCEFLDLDRESGPYLLALSEIGVETTKSKRATLAVSEDTLEYRDERGHLLWGLRPNDIVLIAEYTTRSGPFGDDWFLVFAISLNKTPYFTTCPIYLEGQQQAINSLKTRFSVELRLAGSEDWKSVVLWPKSIERETFFELAEPEPHNWRERFRAWTDGGIRESHLSNAVQKYLKQPSKL